MNLFNPVRSALFSPMQELLDPLLKQTCVELQVLRLDQYGSEQSGNKYFKLKYNIAEAKKRNFKQLLSFGGAYSNHIHALALAGRANNIATIGLIRGEETLPLNDTLADAIGAGMNLIYISREEYRQRHNSQFLSELQQQYPDAYIIPEGGSNSLGVKGCMEITEHIQHHLGDEFDCIFLPCGTAATLAGVAAAAPSKTVYGVAVLKNADYLNAEVEGFLAELGRLERGSFNHGNWRLLQDYHCGGYARISSELADFIDSFQRENAIPIEPIYSAKMFYALYSMLRDGQLKGTKIVAVHCGGLQGLRGLKKRYPQLLSA